MPLSDTAETPSPSPAIRELISYPLLELTTPSAADDPPPLAQTMEEGEESDAEENYLSFVHELYSFVITKLLLRSVSM